MNLKSNDIISILFTCASCYFDDIMRVGDFGFSNVLLSKTITWKFISYKSIMDVNPLYIRFDKVHGFIEIHDGTGYLVLYGPEGYDAMCDRIKYLINEKVVSHIVLIIILKEPELILIDFYL